LTPTQRFHLRRQAGPAHRPNYGRLVNQFVGDPRVNWFCRCAHVSECLILVNVCCNWLRYSGLLRVSGHFAIFSIYGEREPTMSLKLVKLSTLLALGYINLAVAADSDVEAGEKLFGVECKVCHGNAASAAVAPADGLIRATLESRVPGDGQAVSRRLYFAKTSMLFSAVQHRGPVLSVAPPFGPNLQGVYGRAAGTAPGFQYSQAFLGVLKGMIWDEAALDVWISNTQAWVPGVYMFYKQKDAEVRRKIIAYLKASSEH
jgi:cytochrome c2